MKKTYFYFLIIVIIIACRKESFPNFIDTELSPFIDSFIEEGEKRGVSLSKDILEAHLLEEFTVSSAAETTCGFGWDDYNFNGKDYSRIEILMNENCWLSRSYIEKEGLVFHELGHALLGRGHLNETLPNQSPKSIMCSINESDDCLGVFGIYYDNEMVRNYYLDELFNAATPVPDFALNTSFVRTAVTENFDQPLEDWELYAVKDGEVTGGFPIFRDSMNENSFSPPYSLHLTNENFSDDEYIFVLKRYELTDFDECSNLKVRADIKSKGLLDGSFRMTVSLREKLDNGELNRVYLDRQTEKEFPQPNNNYEDYELEVYCISEKTPVITVSFTLTSEMDASLFIDNLEMEFWK